MQRGRTLKSRKAFDLSVYFVLDPHCCAGRDIAEIAMKAVQGGVSMVQLRNKIDPKRVVAAQAAMLCELLKDFDVPFLVNDYVDIAKDVEADGAHIGQGDITPKQARGILGEKAILGLTSFTKAHMSAVDVNVVDYVGTGPFYETKTDKGKPVLGAENFKKIAALSPVPVVGIGGITPDNAMRVIHAGADGVAMMRSISGADDPKGAADAFMRVMESARR